MTDECLESGILLCTLNFATDRPIAFTSLHRHVYTIPLSVSYCYHLVATPRRARQVCFSQFLRDMLPRAAGPYTGVLLEVWRDLTPPRKNPRSANVQHIPVEPLIPIHTADADETKLSSLVASASVVCT